MNWDYLIVALLSYGLCYVIMKNTEDKPKTEWKSKFEWTCVECYPGAHTTLQANSQRHLEQMVEWHTEWHHEDGHDVSDLVKYSEEDLAFALKIYKKGFFNV